MINSIYKIACKYDDIIEDSFVFNHQQYAILNNNKLYEMLNEDYFIETNTNYQNKILIAKIGKIKDDYILYPIKHEEHTDIMNLYKQMIKLFEKNDTKNFYVTKNIISSNKIKPILLKILMFLNFSFKHKLINSNDYNMINTGLSTYINICDNVLASKKDIIRTSKTTLNKIINFAESEIESKEKISLSKNITILIKLISDFISKLKNLTKFEIDDFCEFINLYKNKGDY